MFGRVRSCPSSSSSSSSSSLDSWESDMLPSSKILKLDSLSIYEATLMRLRAGSQVKLTSPPQQAEQMPSSVPTDLLRSSQLLEVSPDDGDPMSIDTCSSATARLHSAGCQTTGDPKESRSRNGSILYLFSKYKNPQMHRAHHVNRQQQW